MKQILVILAITLFVGIFSVKAQETITDEINYNMMERLIQLAKEHYPQRKVIGEQENIAKNNVTVARLSYFDIVNVNYYWRPDEQQTLNPQNPYITNGFQFGVNINPATLFAKPFEVKNAKSSHKIAEYQKESYDAELEKQVKARYYSYVLQLKEFKLKTMAAQTAKGSFLDVSNSYQRGEITEEDYTAARDLIAESDYAKLEAEIAFLSARDNLEEIIGMKITDIK